MAMEMGAPSPPQATQIGLYMAAYDEDQTGFKNALKPSKGISQDKIDKTWDFMQPSYDERSSCFMNAGTHHGVGHKQPVGTHEVSSKLAVPYGRPNTMKVDEKG